MPTAPKLLTYANVFDYLLDLGRRFQPIGQSELTHDGTVRATNGYPLLVVEGDVQGSDLYRNGTEPSGVEQFAVGIQVLTQCPATAEAIADTLRLTKGWAQALCQQVRKERSQHLIGVNWLALPGIAGEGLGTGWRVELTLKLSNDIDRTASAALFTPEAV